MNLVCPKCSNKYDIPEGVFKSANITTFRCYKCEHESSKNDFDTSISNDNLEDLVQKTNSDNIPVENINFNALNKTSSLNQSEILKKIAAIVGVILVGTFIIYMMIKK